MGRARANSRHHSYFFGRTGPCVTELTQLIQRSLSSVASGWPPPSGTKIVGRSSGCAYVGGAHLRAERPFGVGTAALRLGETREDGFCRSRCCRSNPNGFMPASSARYASSFTASARWGKPGSAPRSERTGDQSLLVNVIFISSSSIGVSCFVFSQIWPSHRSARRRPELRGDPRVLWSQALSPAPHWSCLLALAHSGQAWPAHLAMLAHYPWSRVG